MAGEYQDRRTLKNIDCSKTIWILATNALDDTIIKFCNPNPAIFSDDPLSSEPPSKNLSKELRKAFLDHFGAPVTGRISDFVPFLPFSPGEQAVVARKFLLELANNVRLPVNLSAGPDERLLGDVKLRIRRDAKVCAYLAAEEYSEDLGARSLRSAIQQVEDRLVERYLQENNQISEGNELQEYLIELQGDEIAVSKVGQEEEYNGGI
jgi:ATP-dependent Clp protease ATP-binding subunit ClpA